MNDSIHPDTKLGHVHLTVSDLDRSLEFYQQIIGLQVHRRQGETAYLGAGRADILALTGRPDARRVTGATGLYHFAILTPSRLALAHSLRRIAETQTPVQGFADHWVSEAIYLADPDGNGIEIYRDRPRDEWPYRNGRLQMASDPLDLEGVLAELEGHAEPWTGLAPGTVLGHMHLHVAHIAQAEAFYQGVIGFDLMLRYGPSASFLSAGGYHHHLGVNTWAGVGAPPPPADAIGLRWYVICLPDQAELDRTVDRVRRAGVEVEEQPEGLLLRDPSQNGLILTA
ncbi:MAG: VOC family protein [Chloroflexota bacterium]